MKNFNLLLKNIISDESGQDLIEYALVASVISLGAVATLTPLATGIGNAFTAVTTSLSTAIPAAK
jgi:pilus assembly protein Flp/PilA